MFRTEKKICKNHQTLNLLRTFSYSLACLSGKWDSVIKSPRFLSLSFFLHFMHLLQIWAVITIKHFIFFGCLLQLVYYEQTLHSYKAINCSIPQIEALLFTVPVWLIRRSGCPAWSSKLELWEPPLRRCGTQNSIQWRRHSFHCTHRIYQPRIPRAPFLCGCYYSSLQCGGRDEGLEICWPRTQHHQWVGERNILHRWK